MELTIALQGGSRRRGELFGPGDRHLRMIRDTLDVQLSARDDTLRLSGSSEAVGRAAAVIERLQKQLREQGYVRTDDVEQALGEDHQEQAVRKDSNAIDVYARGAVVVPKTPGQKVYVNAVHNNDLVFCLGPAGTGKTYLAVALAVSALKRNLIRRIVLVRPAVEAGEKLGFLPGDLQQKVNPYLRPLLDAMHDMMNFDQLKRFMINDVVEVIPLAYMRGRTLNNAAIILDEAQNTTPSQMLMFLTRLGHDSTMIVTGDDSQIDLDDGQQSGLIDAVTKLRNVPGVAVVRLKREDIVRHHLVQDIVDAYGRERNGPGS